MLCLLCLHMPVLCWHADGDAVELGKRGRGSGLLGQRNWANQLAHDQGAGQGGAGAAR